MSIYKKSAKLALLFVLIFLLVQIRHHTFPVQGQGINYSVYMPLIQNGGQTGNLDNLGTVEHADGVGVGAYGTTLTQPINVDISSVTAPATPLPAGVQALAGYYQIRADADTYVSPTAPFVLAFPIPAGSPTGNLALGVLLPGEDYLDWEPSEPVWDFLEGKYDSARNLFLTTIPFLAQDGHTFVLVDHPDIPSVPIQHLPARVTGASSGNFVVICRGFHHGECPEAAEDQVGSLLDELYTTFSDLSYPEPRLRALIEPLEWPPNAPAPAFWQYAIYLEPLLNCRIGSHGKYNHGTGELVLCQDDWSGGVAYQSDRHKTLIHEYFHALQFGFVKVRADYKAVKEEIWIIEGMARAVEESYFVAGMKRSQRFGNELHPVDISLRDEFWSYQAQDFWVYAGQAGGEDIGYLRQILTWGASTESVKAGMPVLGFSFPEMVWKWSKNQMMEKAIDTDGTLGTPCILDHAHPVADPDNFYHIFDWYTATGTIPPLTSAVVTIGWSFNPGPLWVIELYSNGNPSHEVKYKVYVEGENICDGSIPDGPRKLTFLPGITYYVLLTNTSDTAPHDFNVIVGG